MKLLTNLPHCVILTGVIFNTFFNQLTILFRDIVQINIRIIDVSLMVR